MACMYEGYFAFWTESLGLDYSENVGCIVGRNPTLAQWGFVLLHNRKLWQSQRRREGAKRRKLNAQRIIISKLYLQQKIIILHVLSWSLIRYIFWNNAMLPLSYIGLLWMIGFLDALASHDFKLSVKSAINVFLIIKVF